MPQTEALDALVSAAKRYSPPCQHEYCHAVPQVACRCVHYVSSSQRSCNRFHIGKSQSCQNKIPAVELDIRLRSIRKAASDVVLHRNAKNSVRTDHNRNGKDALVLAHFARLSHNSRHQGK